MCLPSIYNALDCIYHPVKNLIPTVSSPQVFITRLVWITRQKYKCQVCAYVYVCVDVQEAVRNSVCHNATVMANALMHCGTTSDQFLRCYWLLALLYSVNLKALCQTLHCSRSCQLMYILLWPMTDNKYIFRNNADCFFVCRLFWVIFDNGLSSLWRNGVLGISFPKTMCRYLVMRFAYIWREMRNAQ